MATFELAVKNVALNYYRSTAVDGTLNFKFDAVDFSGVDPIVAGQSQNFQYSEASNGSLVLQANVEIPIMANKTITDFGLYKGSNDINQFRITINTPEVFQFAGVITVETATISLLD